MANNELSLVPQSVTIPLSAEMREQFAYLRKHDDRSVPELALELLAEELEARVGLMRGPYLRKYIYR
jgi:hypothetical protein